jgi:hypothetical protein
MCSCVTPDAAQHCHVPQTSSQSTRQLDNVCRLMWSELLHSMGVHHGCLQAETMGRHS